jgi:hypothetical protein
MGHLVDLETVYQEDHLNGMKEYYQNLLTLTLTNMKATMVQEELLRHEWLIKTM